MTCRWHVRTAGDQTAVTPPCEFDPRHRHHEKKRVNRPAFFSTQKNNKPGKNRAEACPSLFGIAVQSSEEFLIGTTVKFAQLNQDAGSDIQLAGFVFLIGRAAYIAAPSLQFRADFFL